MAKTRNLDEIWTTDSIASNHATQGFFTVECSGNYVSFIQGIISL